MAEVLKRQRKLVDALGIGCLQRHIFLCCDQSKPKCCDREDSLEAWSYLTTRLEELELTGQGGVYRTKANCLRVCEGGPVAVVYPEGNWCLARATHRPRYLSCCNDAQATAVGILDTVSWGVAPPRSCSQLRATS